MRSLLGTDEAVLNLRPVDKARNVGKRAYFSYKAHTVAQRM